MCCWRVAGAKEMSVWPDLAPHAVRCPTRWSFPVMVAVAHAGPVRPAAALCVNIHTVVWWHNVLCRPTDIHSVLVNKIASSSSSSFTASALNKLSSSSSSSSSVAFGVLLVHGVSPE